MRLAVGRQIRSGAAEHPDRKAILLLREVEGNPAENAEHFRRKVRFDPEPQSIRTVERFSHSWRSGATPPEVRSTSGGSEHRQVPLELPLGELNAVVVPLLPLQLDVAVEDVWTERLARDLGLGQLVDRLAKRLG